MRYPFRHHLDGDALLYWTLLMLILLSYILLVFAILTGLFPFQNGRYDVAIRIVLNVAAAIVLLVTFRPVYRWAQSGVRDLVYGQHESPYPALAQLNQQLESTPSPQSILPTIASTIAEALKLSYVEIAANRLGMEQGETQLTTSFGKR